MRCDDGLERSGILSEKVRLAKEVYLLRFEVEGFMSSIMPGQFFMIGPCRWKRDPLLLRPFAVADKKGDTLEFLVKVAGFGTNDIVRCEIGSPFRLRGPLGRGVFKPLGKSVALVAGGIGVAPLVFARKYYPEVVSKFVLGVPNGDWADVASWVKSECPDVVIACDDGTIGERGTAADVLLNGKWPIEEVWACGPVAMFKAIYAGLNDRVRILGSFESRMGCGIGGCHSCSIPTKNGMTEVCRRGPVLDVAEVCLDELI